MAENENSGPGEQDTKASDEKIPADNVLENQLEEALREKEQFRALSQRAQADLANYKRHAVEELEAARRYASSSVLLKVLGVVDDFQRAMQNIPEDSVSASWLEGLKLVERNIENMLRSEGVVQIQAETTHYDPSEQEALFFVETNEVEPGRVVDVVRQGYRLHDRILRAAQVTVSKPEPAPEESNKREGEEDA